LKGWDARRLAASITIAVAVTAGCGGAAPRADFDPSEKSTSPTPTTPAALVPLSTGAVPLPNSCVSANGLPDRACTPGATNPDVTQATISITICVTGYAAQIRPAATYTNSLKIDHMRAYGYAAEAPGDFEEDHLIALELGGDPRDPKNLWPERLIGGSGALQKDRIENWAHDEVCAGRMQLTEAQQRMAANWVELYNTMLAAIATPKPIAPAFVSSTAPTVQPTATARRTETPSLSVLINASRYGLVSATTLAGASCNAQARLPSGNISKAAGLTPTAIALANGAVSWTYGTTTQTNPGTGTHTVTCTLGGITRNATAPFSVP